MASNDDQKLQERIIFLTRFYWLDEIHRIGTELNIEDIKKIKDYWELNHAIASQQIAQDLNDQEFQRLVLRHIPKYLTLGGFQGRFYSMDENKQLTLTSSWEIVTKNITKALAKWDRRAFGVLQSLINKNGKSTYVELINEIENVLGQDYSPSILLPRLESLKLVFKTGSNKYPYWEIPQEIIPLMKEELKKHPQQVSSPIQKIKTNPKKISRKQEFEMLSLDLKLDEMVENFVDRKSEINIIFQDQFKMKFFRDNEKAVIRLMKPCSNEDDFMSRIQWLAVILTDDIEINEIKKLLKNSDDIKGSIDFIESFLNERQIKYEESLIQNLRMLKILRNKKYPSHPDDGAFLEAVRHFDQPIFPPDWTVLWENVLKGTVESLTMFREKLQFIS